jgi:uncharacterized membrane protein
VTWTDWLLSLHVLSAFALMGAIVVFWAVVLATRAPTPLLPQSAVGAISRPTNAIIGAGAIAALVFGVWLAIDIDGYELWDGWILASIVLWLIGSALGERGGRAFARGDAAGWRQGLRLQTAATLAFVVILVLMIFKPGA